MPAIGHQPLPLSIVALRGAVEGLEAPDDVCTLMDAISYALVADKPVMELNQRLTQLHQTHPGLFRKLSAWLKTEAVKQVSRDAGAYWAWLIWRRAAVAMHRGAAFHLAFGMDVDESEAVGKAPRAPSSRRGYKAKGLSLAGQIGGVWDFKDTKRPWQSITREINDALRAIKYDKSQRHKKDIGLLFDLARWGVSNTIPRKSIRHYIEDGELFEILKMHGQIRDERAYGLCDLSPVQLSQLEKRLWHLWADVAVMIDAIEGPKTRLAQNVRSRRNQIGKAKQRAVSLVSATLKQLDS